MQIPALAVVELPAESGVLKDTCTASFPLMIPETSTTGADAQLVLAKIVQFYTFVSAAPASVGSFISSTQERSTDACTAKLYNLAGHLDGSPHGSPTALQTFTLPAPGNVGSLAPQVAGVLTLRGRGAAAASVELANPDAPPATIRPKSRHTGRLYVGPLAAQAGISSTTQPLRPHGNFMQTVVESAENVQDQLATLGAIWCVWSRTDEAMYGVVKAECDNSFDIIRRRKVASSARDSRTFAPVPSLALGA